MRKHLPGERVKVPGVLCHLGDHAPDPVGQALDAR
jgi:hypothetical protein